MSAPSGLPHLCRDCLATFEATNQVSNCPECGSPRLVAHEELQTLGIAHIDCDAFYASVEKRDNPELRDKPLIVGGGKRGVVSTCCYIARMSGVRSAMPMVTALRKCPDAVVVRPDMKKYVGVSRQIRELMLALTPEVEPLSIDEAFLDLRGTEKLHHAFPAQSLARMALAVEQQIGVTVSVGLSHNKFLAKIASDLDKPRGMALIGVAETKSFLARQPISIIFGVGKVMTERLRRDGLVSIGQLQTMPAKDLIKRYGEMGARLAHLASGEDRRRVSTNRAAKSISSETTFFDDISDASELQTILLNLCEKVADRLKKQKLVGHTLTLKLKTAGFTVRTRARHLALPTQLAHVIYENAADLLIKETDGTKYRLIGIGLSGFEPAHDGDPSDLLEPRIAKKAAAERAMDDVRHKFGQDAVVRGRLYRQNRSGKLRDPEL
ncbi:MAG: DNA polymerase IV [Hyphomicrobiaceae bacterium]|nr:DNA polymerase IV [Hyphomicrobiaceae bacterium]